MTLEEEALENLEEFKRHYSGNIPPVPEICSGTVAALTQIVLQQQKEISELKDYVEDQKREARLASEDWN